MRPMKLEKIVRPSGMTISEFVIKFDQLYFEAKSFHLEILNSVLTYTLLNCGKFTNEKKQLIKATVSKMDYQTMKDRLKKVFNSTSTNVHNKN